MATPTTPSAQPLSVVHPKKVKSPNKAELFFAHAKSAAPILTNAIALQNAKGLKGVNRVNPAAASMMHGIRNLVIIEMSKLLTTKDGRKKLEHYLSDACDCLPLTTNNPQLADLLYPESAALPTEQKVSKFKSTICRYKNALRNADIIRRTDFLSKIEVGGQIIYKAGGRAGFVLWIPKRFFGIYEPTTLPAQVAPQNDDLSVPNAAIPPVMPDFSEPFFGTVPTAKVPKMNQSLLGKVPTSLLLEIEEKRKCVFVEKQKQEMTAQSALQEATTTESNNIGICNNRTGPLFPPVAVAPQNTNGQPSEAANTSRVAQKNTIFAEKLTTQITDAYNEAATRQQVVAFKGQPIDQRQPLTNNQLKNILPQMFLLLEYFGGKMPTAEAFELLTKSIKKTADYLKKYPDNFIYLPQSFLSVETKTDGTFRMETGSLRYIAENWKVKDNPKEYPETARKTEIINQNFVKLAKFGVDEFWLKKQYEKYCEQQKTVSSEGFVLAIADFVRKASGNNPKISGDVAYLVRMWQNGYKHQKATVAPTITRLEAAPAPAGPTERDIWEAEKRQTATLSAKEKYDNDNRDCAAFIVNNPQWLAETLTRLNIGRVPQWTAADFVNNIACNAALIAAWKKTL